MITLNSTEKTTYYILRNKDFSVIHFGSVNVGQSLSSGQEILEEFTDKNSLIDRLNEMNVVFNIDSI